MKFERLGGMIESDMVEKALDIYHKYLNEIKTKMLSIVRKNVEKEAQDARR